MTKSTIGVFAAVVFLVGVALLAGCGRSAGPAGPAAGGAGVQQPAGPAAAEGPGAEQPAVAASGDKLADITKNRAGLKSYEMTMTAHGQTQKAVVKLDGAKMAKMKVDTGDGIMLMDFGAKVHYMYDPKTKVAMKLPLGEGGGEEGMTAEDVDAVPGLDELKKDMGSWKSETVNGVDCWTYISSIENDKGAQIWIDKKYGLPRQVKTGEETIAFSYARINEVADSEFQLPAGAKVQDMGAAVSGAGGGAGQ